MKYGYARVCGDVRLMLNLDERHQSLLDCGDIDTLTVDRLIRSSMPEAVARVELAAPVGLLESGYNFVEEADMFAETVADSRVTVTGCVLPVDFMRLVSFRLSDWTVPVVTAVGPDSRLYALMQLPGASALVDNMRPLAAVVRRPEGRVLLTYSASDFARATVTEAVYRPRPDWDRDGAIDISRLLYNGACEACAALVAAAIRNN